MAGLTFTAFQDGFSRVAIAGVKRTHTSATSKVEFQSGALPALLPDPIRPLDSSTSERLTLNDASGNALWRRTRVFNYVCLVAQVGAGRVPGSHAERASQLADEIENALCDFKIDGVNSLGPVSIRDFGILDDAVSSALPDSSSTKYFGFTIQVRVVSGYRRD